MHNYYKKNNVIPSNNWNSASKSLTNCHLYNYCSNNPVRYMDPDGNFVESPWDVVSLVTGVASLVADVRADNIKGAIIDGIGIVVDAAAVAFPGIPGGVGTALKAAGAAANVAGGALSIKDGLENGDYFEVGAGILQAASGLGEAKALTGARKVSDVADSAKVAQTSKEFSVPEPLENHSMQTGKVGSLKAKGTPNSSIDLYNKDGDLLQR